MSTKRTVVLVGHCGPDMFMLRSAVNRAVPGVTITAVNDHEALGEHLAPDSVLLINRALDGRFDTESGIELIETVSDGEASPVSILISDLPDAQLEAEAAGGRPGFGKTQLYDEATARILKDAIEA